MKTKIFLLFIFLSLVTVGQHKIRFPLWTFNTDSTTIDGVSVGYMHTNKIKDVITNGIRIEFLGFGAFLFLMPNSPIVNNDSIFDKFMNEKSSETINGINLSLLGHGGDCSINGLSIYLLGNVVKSVNGLSISFLINASQQHNGVQVGISNMAYSMKGVQIGLFNTTEKIKGVQIGLWNKNSKRELPIINW